MWNRKKCECLHFRIWMSNRPEHTPQHALFVFSPSFSSMPHYVIRQFYIREARRESGLRSVYSQSGEAMLINHLLFQPPTDPSGTWRIALHALKESEREEREREIQIKLAYDTRNWTIFDMILIFVNLRYQRAMPYNTDDLSVVLSATFDSLGGGQTNKQTNKHENQSFVVFVHARLSGTWLLSSSSVSLKTSGWALWTVSCYLQLSTGNTGTFPIRHCCGRLPLWHCNRGVLEECGNWEKMWTVF